MILIEHNYKQKYLLMVILYQQRGSKIKNPVSLHRYWEGDVSNLRMVGGFQN